MTTNNQIPSDIKKRLLFFKDGVREEFSFLRDFNYFLDEEEFGRTENFKNYFFKFSFRNVDRLINIHFSTDIINGMKISFPSLKEEELPSVDSSISCSIWDKTVFMSVHSYIETKFPDIPQDDFTIKMGSLELELEITKVIKNYSDFFKTNLTSVLEKKIIYNCYTDRFNDKVFKEIHKL